MATTINDLGLSDIILNFDQLQLENINLTQGDTMTRGFDITITSKNGEVLTPSSNYTIKLFGVNSKNPDKTYYTIGEIVNEKYRVYLSTPMVGFAGSVKLQIALYKDTTALIQSNIIELKVDKSLANGGEVGENLVIDFIQINLAIERIEQLENNYTQSLTTQNALYQDVITKHGEVVTYHNQLSTTLAKENERISSENTRISNENIRESNESSRVNAESNRATAETNRVGAENARVGAESTRVTAESTRVTVENARVGAENTRSTAETNRVSAEDSRVIAESGRVSTENTRISNENSRDTQWTNLKSELQTLMGQLEDIDVGNLQVQINSTNATVANKVDKVDGKGLSTNDYDNTSKGKVDNIPANPVYTDTITTVVNNLTTTSTTSALSANQGKILNDNKVDKVDGKGLSTNDYDNTSKGKVDNIPANPKYTDTITTVVNNLTTTSTTSALSANQGKILNDNKMDKSGGTFTGQVKAQSNADYSVGQIRNIASGTALPSTSGFGNGDIFIVRSS